MSQFVKKKGLMLLALAALVGVLALSAMAFTTLPASNAPPRQVLLVARDNAFRFADQPDANPVLRFKKGEKISLTIRNDEPGKVLHCITLGDLNVKTAGSIAAGESETLLFTPKTRGTFVYACLMHPSMAGAVVVE